MFHAWISSYVLMCLNVWYLSSTVYVGLACWSVDCLCKAAWHLSLCQASPGLRKPRPTQCSEASGRLPKGTTGFQPKRSASEVSGRPSAMTLPLVFRRSYEGQPMDLIIHKFLYPSGVQEWIPHGYQCPILLNNEKANVRKFMSWKSVNLSLLLKCILRGKKS